MSIFHKVTKSVSGKHHFEMGGKLCPDTIVTSALDYDGVDDIVAEKIYFKIIHWVAGIRTPGISTADSCLENVMFT